MSWADLFSYIPTLILIVVPALCLIGASEEIFGKFMSREMRLKLWPLEGKEAHKTFLPKCMLMFISLFAYSALRIHKDALIQYAPHSGSEVLHYLKMFGVLPSSILFVTVYSNVSNRLKGLSLYVVLSAFFGIMFTLFGCVLMQGGEDSLFFGPNGIIANINIMDSIQGSPETLKSWQDAFPMFKYLFPLFFYWVASLFYIITELWGTASVSLLVFQLANAYTNKDQASTRYPLLGIIGNIGMSCSGFVNSMQMPFDRIILMVAFGCLSMVLIYYYLFTHALPKKPEKAESTESGKTKSKKPKLSLMESFTMLKGSSYLIYIALIVFAYNSCMNAVEITWKKQASEYFTNAEYKQFNGIMQTWTASISILLMFLGKGLISYLGWLPCALITPIMLLVTGGAFFLFSGASMFMPQLFACDASYLIQVAVMVGAIQNIATKSTKYSLFDPTKEMLYIPLDDEKKTKGKAAVDVIAGRLGKSAGGLIQLLLLTIATLFNKEATQMHIMLPIAAFVLLLIFIWIWAIKNAYKQYTQLNVTQSENSESKSK